MADYWLSTWFAHILCCLYSFLHLKIFNIGQYFGERDKFFNLLKCWEKAFGLLLNLDENRIVFIGRTVWVTVCIALLIVILSQIPRSVSKFGFLKCLARLANELFQWWKRSGGLIVFWDRFWIYDILIELAHEILTTLYCLVKVRHSKRSIKHSKLAFRCLLLQ
jgi:hypothetical protein